MIIGLDEPCLVLLIGPSGSGKSTFARRHFRPTEILSSDFCRGLVCDDENDQTATGDAFELLHLILEKRLSRRRTTVVDATNVQLASRASLRAVALQHGLPVVAVVFLIAEELCQQRNRLRSKRHVPGDVIHNQISELLETIKHLEDEGFDVIHTFRDENDVDEVRIINRPELI